MVVVRRSHSFEFKLRVLREIEAGKSAAQVCREHRLDSSLIKKWKRQRRELEEAVASGATRRGEAERIAELERLIGQLSMENQLLKKALVKLESSSKDRIVTGRR